MRACLYAILAFLAACAPPVPAPPAPSSPGAAPAALEAVPAAPLAEITAEAAQVVAEPLDEAQDAVSDAVQAVVPVEPPLRPTEALVHPQAVALMVRYEIISEGYYRKRLAHPIWPGGASGVTWCIGYDGGHQTSQVIAQDWIEHPAVLRLVMTAGVRGNAAKAALKDYRDIISDFPLCQKVFSERTLIEYERRTARLFRNGYDGLPFLVKGVLVSMVYNRGASTVGDNRREVKAMVEVCVPHGDLACLAREMRASKRVWNGSSIEAGMHRRRDEEAALIESAM